jgi:hypothetical protein
VYMWVGVLYTLQELCIKSGNISSINNKAEII